MVTPSSRTSRDIYPAQSGNGPPIAPFPVPKWQENFFRCPRLSWNRWAGVSQKCLKVSHCAPFAPQNPAQSGPVLARFGTLHTMNSCSNPPETSQMSQKQNFRRPVPTSDNSLSAPRRDGKAPVLLLSPSMTTQTPNAIALDNCLSRSPRHFIVHKAGQHWVVGQVRAAGKSSEMGQNATECYTYFFLGPSRPWTHALPP